MDDSRILTKEEQSFAKKYKANLESHFQTLVLKYMPGDFGRLTFPKGNAGAPAPDLDCSVFVAVEKEIRGLFIEDDTLKENDVDLDMDVGGQHILR